MNTSIEDKKVLITIENLLLKTISQSKEDKKLYLRLAENYRQQGKFKKAKKYYQKFQQLSISSEIERIINIFDQSTSLNENETESISMPSFIYLNDFLSNSEQENIWDELGSQESLFRKAEISHRLDKERRSASVLFKKEVPNAIGIIKSKIYQLSNQINYFSFLETLDINGAKVHLTRHLNNDFLTPHRDNMGKGPESKRKWTFVYYFYKEPKSFKGGDLLLYDTCTKTDQVDHNYTRIIPKNNSILFFPSGYYHKVTKVIIDNDDTLQGRFTLNGWLREKEN